MTSLELKSRVYFAVLATHPAISSFDGKQSEAVRKAPTFAATSQS